MPLNHQEILKLAGILDQAMLEAKERERLTVACPDLNLTDAYKIQDEGITYRINRGEKVIGLKMGLTSQAKREQMGLDTPIYGVLTDRMKIPDGGKFRMQGSIHPKIEPEIAFKMVRDLKGKVSLEEALAACSGVCPAMEILDSRFLNFKYFSLPDVVADNSSSSMFVLGSAFQEIGNLDLPNLEMVMEVNGVPVQTAMSSAISGNPAQSLVQLCEILDSRGLFLKAGSIVMAGAATQAVQLKVGDQIRLTVKGLGAVSISTAE